MNMQERTGNYVKDINFPKDLPSSRFPCLFINGSMDITRIETKREVSIVYIDEWSR